jgi:DNA-binding NarL/FixJ family response regulator
MSDSRNGPVDLLRCALGRLGVDEATSSRVASTTPDGREWAATWPDGRTATSLEQLRGIVGQRRRWKRSTLTSSPLTDREEAVAELLASGMRTAEIAARLELSPRTVTAARQAIRNKAAAAPRGEHFDAQVLGRATLLRDLVVDSLTAHGITVAPAGTTAVSEVSVLVEPSVRDMAAAGHSRSIVVGDVPASVSRVTAIELGVLAVLSHTTTEAELMATVERAQQGRPSFSSRVVAELVDELWQRGKGRAELSAREREVLVGVGQGESVKQTARRLGLSPKTVENHRQQAFRKLGVRSAEQARVRYASLDPGSVR